MEKFEDLLGKTLSSVHVIEDKEIIFSLPNDEQYKLYHLQDCCESVTIEDINGDIQDLVGSPILMAEVVTQKGVNPEGIIVEYQDSFTWTFYKLATIKGYVTIR